MKLCLQCNKERPDFYFLGGRRNPSIPTKLCCFCRERYTYTKAEERSVKTWRNETREDEKLRVRFTRKSRNQKTGPIPVSTTSPHTCPPSCHWYGAGCYAESHYIGHRWRKTPEQGLTWPQFCNEVMKLPSGQIWRHNEAGDLPGLGEHLDVDLLSELVFANYGRRGFTYTHKKDPRCLPGIEWANFNGFAVNISCDSFDEVDWFRKHRVRAPLTVVIGDDMPMRTTTKGGAHVIVCPAQRTDITCEKCQLCAVRSRKSVVAFLAHGSSKRILSEHAERRQVRLPLVG